MAAFVALDTSLGTMVLELYTRHAPKTCENFVALAGKGYYDGTVFYRVTAGMVVQGGDPTGRGDGGKSSFGERTFVDEINPELRYTGPGIISMGNLGPDTNTSQFFLTLGPMPWLDGRHTIFGRVFSGLPTLKRIGAIKVGKDERPLEDVVIVKARVLASGDGAIEPAKSDTTAVTSAAATGFEPPTGSPGFGGKGATEYWA